MNPSCLIITKKKENFKFISKLIQDTDSFDLRGNPPKFHKDLIPGIDYIFMDLDSPARDIKSALTSGVKVCLFSKENDLILEGTNFESKVFFQSRGVAATSGAAKQQIELKIQPKTLQVNLGSLPAAIESGKGSMVITMEPSLLSLETESQKARRKRITGDVIFVKSESKIHRIKLDEIFYVEALKDYVMVHAVNGEFKILNSMKNVEARLPENDFFRAHRSYIVRIDKIKAIKDDDLLTEKDAIPIGPSFRSKLMRRLKSL